MSISLYLNDSQQMLTEVPVTPATRVIDVVEYCKEAGEGDCHLAEVWSGHGEHRGTHTHTHNCMVNILYMVALNHSWCVCVCVCLTLSELQEMATRQQQQIEAQQQIWMETGLFFLTPICSVQSEAEKLQRLKERVESQEAKLKKIRAMRGQVDYSKLINGNLSAEINHVSSLFQEKQAELQSAVIRVDQLTQQLEDLRRGRLQLQPAGSPLSGPAAVELRKLYQELQARNRHNLEQSSKLAQNKDLLNRRNAQVTVMDKRIGDLRERLHKKRAEARHTHTHMHACPPSPQTSPHTGGAVSGRVAAVCPYIQVPAGGRQEAGYPLPSDPPPKPTPLSHIRSLSGSTTTSQSSPLPQTPQMDRSDPPPAAAVRPYVPDHPSRPQSPRKGPATMNSSSIYSMYLQQPQAKNYGSLSNRTTVKAVYGKPVLPNSSTTPSPVPFLQGIGGGGGRGGGGGEDVVDKEMMGGGRGGESGDGQILPPPSVENIPRPLSPTKLTPVAHSPLRYQSDADLEVLRRRLSNAPRPLKKRSSITEPEGPQGPNIQKLLYQRFNTLAGGMEGGTGKAVGRNPFYQPGCLLGDMDNIHSANGNVELGEKHAAPVEDEGQNLNSDSHRLSPPSVAAETATETSTTVAAADSASPSAQPSPPPASDRPEDHNNNNQRGSSPSNNSAKRTNLKKPSSERTGHGLRVKFNPLALLLDASLEGEFDLVQRIIYEVENPSTPNDEGITPLHNAVCAGHHHIVKFLLDFGVNVNAADSDGWTPLHCAASCNSVHLCKMLVESGAAIFATTISDVETAADKCEEMEEGYTQCSQFLYGVQEKLGVMNKGSVYALWDYTSQQADELSFSEGDALTVLRRRDDTETEWWWARLNDREGYVPRNLLGVRNHTAARHTSMQTHTHRGAEIPSPEDR
uniref:Protein phosphatase 1, regulatory subunit 13Ba n=1 Tax=Myripristis murdjan TaxID=586833 RepID=A0A667XJP3_9TELE